MEEDDELFEVEYFLNTRVKDGKRYYKVRWKGFPPEEDTWEPEENVLECEEVLEAFWRKRRRNANKRQKLRRDRLMSEGEDQDTASTSRENKATAFFGDIEPLGLTRQASKELAMCMSQTRKTKTCSESSSQAGSDVALMESDVSNQPSSKSTLLSSQTGSDITASDNDVFSQSSDVKSSETGDDILNRSTESTNESNSTDVIHISSHESLNQSDLESSPLETLDKNIKSNSGKTNNIEIISLLSDSEDNNSEVTGSRTQSPRVLQTPLDVSRDSSPVIRRESLETPESTPTKFSQSNGAQDTKKAFDTSSEQSPGFIKENDEDQSIFGTPVRRKNRFELSLKKNRKRSLNKKESSSSESPKTEEEVLNFGAKIKNHDNSSDDESLVKIKGKTQLQTLKERMLELENSEKILEKSDSEFLEISEPKAERALIKGDRSNESSMVDNVCPTITELKGIMHKIARDKYQKHIDAEQGEGTEMACIKNRESSDVSCSSSPDLSKAKTSKTMSHSDERRAVEKMLPEDDDVQEKQDGLNLCSSDVSKRLLVKDDEHSTFDGRMASIEDSATACNDEGESNAMISISLSETKDENLKDIEKDEISCMYESPSLEKGDHLQRRPEEEGDNSIGEATLEKGEEEKRETIKERTSAVEPRSSKKGLVLTSETTSRVLKNLRFLAAKTRESKNVEATMNLATTENTQQATEKNNDGINGKKIESENNLGNTNADNENNKLVLEEKLVGSEKQLNEDENTSEKEIGRIAGVEEGNKSRETDEKKKNEKDELGLIDVRIKPIHKESIRNDNDVKSRVEKIDDKCTEINNSIHETEKMQNIESLTDKEIKPATPERTQVVVPYTEELRRSRYDSLSRAEKNCEMNTKDKTSDDFNLVDVDDMMREDSENCTNSSATIKPKSSSDVQSSFINDTASTHGCLGDHGTEETLVQNFQKHSSVESSAAEEKNKQKNRKPKKMLKKSHENTAAGKRVKRKKPVQSMANNVNSNQGVEKGTASSSSMKSNLRHSKAMKRAKVKKNPKMDKKEESNTTTAKAKSNPQLQNTREEQSKKSSILDANFSSSLTSGDLIGAIIGEGNRENILEENQKKSCATENNNSNDLVAAREDEDMMIEDDEDFDFELEDFPLEKLLQEEDDIYVRCIPSPPVEPMEVPFASVKTAIRDGDEMTVRAALAGELELDTLDGASGMTLLMLAAASGQDGVVELLLRRKADLNACQKNGMTALMHACEQGFPETAHVLLLYGADINKQQIAGETALMKACKKGHTDVVEVLLRNGADTRLESKSGHTAQHFAIRGYPELSSLIEEHEKRLGRVIEEAILKCLGDTVSLCKPPILSHRCVVPREGQQMTFPFQYFPQLYDKEVDVILFCIKAVFDDVVSLLFGEDNGVRGVLLNNKPQIPLLHGVRSIFSIDPKSRQNTITLQTHKCNNPASRIILCTYAVQSKS